MRAWRFSTNYAKQECADAHLLTRARAKPTRLGLLAKTERFSWSLQHSQLHSWRWHGMAGMRAPPLQHDVLGKPDQTLSWAHGHIMSHLRGFAAQSAGACRLNRVDPPDECAKHSPSQHCVSSTPFAQQINAKALGFQYTVYMSRQQPRQYCNTPAVNLFSTQLPDSLRGDLLWAGEEWRHSARG